MASPAHACKQALKDANARWPRRSKVSDGIMGDARHQATKSDHNAGNAVDITHDPVVGCTGDLIAEAALEDSRVSYVIWNKQINSRDGRGWRKYTGKNPHTKHCHISIHMSARDDASVWSWGTTSFVGPKELAPPSEAESLMLPVRPKFPRLLKLGESGPEVTTVQSLFSLQGWKINVDGHFTTDTQKVVKAFQIRKDLPPDGRVDFFTWRLLWESASLYPTIQV